MHISFKARRYAAVALAVAYPLIAHGASILESRRLTIASVVVLAAAILARPLLERRRWAWLAVPVAALAIAALWRFDAAALVLFLPPVLLNVYLAWLFGHTLARGSVPLVERLARLLQPAGVPLEPGVVEYTGLLTKLWTALFILLAATNLVLAVFATRATWSLFANVLNYLIVAILFLIEFAYRRRRFPGRPYRNLPDFLRRAAAVAPALAATVSARSATAAADDRVETMETSIRVPSHHPAFAAHFPGRPLLPGVMLLESVIDAASALFADPHEIAELLRVKFLAPLAPGDRAILSLARRGERVDFAVWREAEHIAQGVFRMRACGTRG
jgi:uncharacterized membrane protein